MNQKKLLNINPQDLAKEYNYGEVIIAWQSAKFIYSGNCVKNNPTVFKPKEKPWITAENAHTYKIIATIDKCPSGALTYYYKNK
jgi:uncharacterized Fe-S cluster protein YjdI